MSQFYNEHAEKSVLAAFMLEDTQDMTQLMPEDFYFEEHRQIFEAMIRLMGERKKPDLVNLSDMLRKLYGQREDALTNKAIEIQRADSLGAQYRLNEHIAIIKAAAQRRRVFTILNDGRKELRDEETDTGVVIDKMRQELRDVVITSHTWETMPSVLKETFEALGRRSRGEEPSMPSGISELDRTTTGFHKGELTIIGARPAVGKSALGAHIALATAKNGYKVGIVSREMTSVQYGTRILLRETGIESNKMRTGNLDLDDWTKVADAMGLYAEYNVNFMFTTRYIEDLRMEVQKKVDKQELDMLMVDYLQLMQTKKRFDQDYLRVGYISKMLKDMTIDFGISVIALAQVGRSSDGTMPTLAELRGSGDIEQDADNVIFMHRPQNAEDKFVPPDLRGTFEILKQNEKQLIALGVAKQRQGKVGNVCVIFDPARMRFTAIGER